MSRDLPNDPFRFTGDPAEADKHLPHTRFRRERRTASAPPPKPEPVPPKEPEDRAAELLQWEAQIHQTAQDHGDLVPMTDRRTPDSGWRHARLPDSGNDPAGPGGPDATETELTGVIADCRLLMRDVAVRSARLSCGADERLRFIEAACRAALTAAKVGKSVGKLRAASAGAGREETHKRVVFEYAHTGPAGAASSGRDGDIPTPR